MIVEEKRYSPDKIIIASWYLNVFLFSAIIMIINFILIRALNLQAFLFISSAIIIANAVYILALILRYMHNIYYFTSDGIVIKQGIIRLERYVIPYDGIQNMNIIKSASDRIFGIACLKIETASKDLLSQEYNISGLRSDQYRKIVEYIMKKKGAGHKKIDEKDNVLEAIKELTLEIKGLKTVLSNKKGK